MLCLDEAQWLVFEHSTFDSLGGSVDSIGGTREFTRALRHALDSYGRETSARRWRRPQRDLRRVRAFAEWRKNEVRKADSLVIDRALCEPQQW